MILAAIPLLVVVLQTACGLHQNIIKNVLAVRVSSLSYDNLVTTDLHRAAELGARTLRIAPDDWAVRRLLAYLYMRADEAAKAARLFPIDKNECPDTLTCLLQGQAFYMIGLADEALASWRRVPNIDMYFALHGDTAYGSDRTEAFRLYKLSWEVASTTSAAKHNMFLNLCRMLRTSETISEAIQWCERARGVRNDYWTLVETGRTYYESGRYDSANTVLQEAVDILPDQSAAYQWLGVTLYRVGRTEGGISALSTSVKLNPSSIWPRLELANLFLQQRNYAAAICEYSRSLELTESKAQSEMIQGKLNAIPGYDAMQTSCNNH
jgi:tetratricopeptide (TPR) repeat protein